MGIEEMLRGMAGGDDEDDGESLTREQLKEAGGLDPIPDLKPGDKLKWKGKPFKMAKTPAIGEVIEVIEVITPVPDQSNGPYYRDDFLFATKRHGQIALYAMDSRRFERVE
jgi:hypothetical protein